jgi:ADP-ribosyl-[dinitrogen reductase] hydrolase
MRNVCVKYGILGLCVADALGVPVEFNSRNSLKQNPVIDMREYGSHNQPKGTWSDDSSMTLCLADSLSNGIDYEDIISKFSKWYKDGDYTPDGLVFDIGNSTSNAITRYMLGEDPLKCGGIDEYDCGNGSLMRILPLAFYLYNKYGRELYTKECMDIIQNISSLTHGHKRCHIACGIYIGIAVEIIDGTSNLSTSIENGTARAFEYYNNDEYAEELKHYNRLKDKDFSHTNEDMINSTGYVVDTLEAAIWCLLNTESYKETVLKAVNLGSDTDTLGAVVGGLAGMFYGDKRNKGIPVGWINTLISIPFVINIIEKLSNNLKKLNR